MTNRMVPRHPFRGGSWGRWVMALMPLPIVGLALTSWILTAPAELRRTSPGISPAAPAPIVVSAARTALTWPRERIEGDPAKEFLLDALLAAKERLEAIPAYTATFRKRERVGGRLNAEQTLALKLRHHPFAIYLKFLKPRLGKEAIYAEGFNDDCVIGHNADITRWLVPRVKVAPTDPVALADNRHPITDAGIANLTAKLIYYRRLDMNDPNAVTILDWETDEHGRRWAWSLHTHPDPSSDRPFARVEVRYDPETFFPVRILSYDWPRPGHNGDLELAEQYTYDDLNLRATLTDRDFDPANPEYGFSRF